MKKYKYRKIKPEDIEVMKELREQGLSYKEIGKKFGVTYSTTHYHLSPREKIMAKKRGNKYNKAMTKKQKREKIRKAAPRMKKYIRERYNNDPEFRRNFLDMVIKNEKKRKRNWIKLGLCSKCGKKRRDKRFIQCENCRKASRKRYQAKKSKKIK